MEAKFTVVEDALDREAFKQMIQSAPFRLLQNRIGLELSRAEEACVRSDAALEIRRSQGKVAALRVALELPDKIYKEMQNARR
jgi:hypothetical protein